MEAGDIGGRNDDDVSRRFAAAAALNPFISLSSMAISPSVTWARGPLTDDSEVEGVDETATMFSVTETQLSR